ncbi:tRNA pseudouridine(38-40) synthase TruA [Coralloluteibacterium thermophilus]|uniref:tRNA pseudouridine synthase A n=1 Tax=Coralloluteibacterium thermophilum TaxID=2707049 RepID=A0ABV9NGV9_9GAMM
MRYALGIEYDGTGFLGWQRLPHGRTVQSEVEAALSFVAGEPLEVVCAGRTDSGVHAQCQVVHFDTAAQRSERGWTLGMNSRLPPEIATRWCRPVSDDFHARFGAIARTYRYRILNRPLRPALQRDYVAFERRPLDADAMHAAAQALIGEHDFSAFRTVHCQAPHARRDMQAIRVWRDGDEVLMEIRANAFLHHMVRNIMGSLLPIGRGERPVGWMAELLAGRDRALAGPTAPASGLTFLGPRYPQRFELPDEVSA